MRSMTIEFTWVGRLFLNEESYPASACFLYPVLDPRRDSIYDVPPSLVRVQIKTGHGILVAQATDSVRFETLDGARFQLGMHSDGGLSLDRWLA